MQEQDAVLAEIIREMREERGRRGGFDDSRLRERVEVLGPEVSLEALRDAVSTALVDRLGVSWDERYGELKLYKERFGDCNVPDKWEENPPLGSWVSTPRIWGKKGKISPSRRARLDELGFDWDPLAAAWEAMFSKFKAYKDRFGHCNVSRWEEEPELGRWVSKQRALENTGRMSADRKIRLVALEFVWDHLDAVWETMFTELKAYKEEHGHCDVPRWENPNLAGWVGMCCATN